MEFSTGASLRYGWETFKTRPGFFIGATVVIILVSGAVSVLTSGIDAAITGSVDEPSLIGSLLNTTLGILVSMGATAFYLKAHDDTGGVTLSSLWHPRPFWKYLLASFLLGITIAIGFVLLIVPGIIFTLMFLFTTFIVVDRELGPIDAMKESHRITRGHKWPLLGFLVLLMLINLAGLMALVVGLLVTIPVTSLAFTHAYRVLGGRAASDAAMPMSAAV
jgi:uncharacterized membrane protein